MGRCHGICWLVASWGSLGRKQCSGVGDSRCSGSEHGEHGVFQNLRESGGGLRCVCGGSIAMWPGYDVSLDVAGCGYREGERGGHWEATSPGVGRTSPHALRLVWGDDSQATACARPAEGVVAPGLTSCCPGCSVVASSGCSSSSCPARGSAGSCPAAVLVPLGSTARSSSARSGPCG